MPPRTYAHRRLITYLYLLTSNVFLYTHQKMKYTGGHSITTSTLELGINFVEKCWEYDKWCCEVSARLCEIFYPGTVISAIYLKNVITCQTFIERLGCLVSSSYFAEKCEYKQKHLIFYKLIFNLLKGLCLRLNRISKAKNAKKMSLFNLF